ncbi:S-adenosyl-L-methionine-dependent methyltransferase [Zopfochytrium polystomum]|nr:S-adenosyl-L-methionine-dependent methyltransferase [Zopfochytrium polystomum]
MITARARAEEALRPDRILNDALARPLLGANGLALTNIVNAHTNPEARNAVLRHRLFDDAVAAAPERVRQIVILGAGLDSRAYRIHRLATCAVFEIDGNKDIAALKARRVAELAVQPVAASLSCVVADLAEDAWPQLLVENGFDANVPTMWVAEGLLPYLPADAEARLLRHVDRLSPPGSQLVANVWGTGQYKFGISATGSGTSESGSAVSYTVSSAKDERRKWFQGLTATGCWRGEPLLVRTADGVYEGPKWDEAAFARFKVDKKAAVHGVWRMELFTKEKEKEKEKESSAGDA